MILEYLSKLEKTSLFEALDPEVSAAYKAYIKEHKEYVIKAYEWLKDNCPEIFDDIDTEEFVNQITEHDESKWSEEEFEPYAQKWHGDGKKTPEYEAAWKHHWQSNPHHPEYWQGEDMPTQFILEMLCDWLSFGLKQDNPAELIEFYETKAKDDPEKNLSENTKSKIESYLDTIKTFI